MTVTNVSHLGERRKQVRFGIAYPAFIHSGQEAVLRACTVLDVSSDGGQLKLEANEPVPRQFDLFFTANGSVRRECSLMWRHGLYLGVAFAEKFRH